MMVDCVAFVVAAMTESDTDVEMALVMSPRNDEVKASPNYLKYS